MEEIENLIKDKRIEYKAVKNFSNWVEIQKPKDVILEFIVLSALQNVKKAIRIVENLNREVKRLSKEEFYQVVVIKEFYEYEIKRTAILVIKSSCIEWPF